MTSRGSCAPTPHDRTAAVPLNAADEHLLRLVAHLPLAPLGLLLPFLNGGTSSAHRRTRHLCDRGLLTAISTPLRTGSRPARLLLPTELALSMLAQCGAVQPAIQAGLLGLRRTTPTRLLMDLPGRLATYELLALLAGGGSGVASLEAWEQPWRRALPPTARCISGTPRIARLPAAATLAWDSPDRTSDSRYLLLPDTGGLALPALRSTLGHVAEHQATNGRPAMLVIATTTSRRAAAWNALLETVCQARRLPLLAAHVVTWADLHEAARTSREGHQGLTSLRMTAHPVAAARPASPVSAASVGWDRTPPAGSRWHRALPSGPVGHPGQVLGPLDRVILDMVGRHPFLPTHNLAVLLDRDVRWARIQRAHLAARGLLRVVSAEELATPELARRGLLELTRGGLQVLASQLGLPLGAAVRHHGLAGGGPATPMGPRAALLAHLPHTLGADAVFALLARAAGTYPGGGALLEWRNAAACAHGRLRPDGYGLLRLGQQQHGFFLEFDRGSMRPGRLRAKFVAYHRYRASAHAGHSYTGFPLVLVVTTGPGPERRLAQAIRAADAGQAAPLPALLTTAGLLASAPGGPFGRIWQTAGDPARRLLTGSGDTAHDGYPAGWLHRRQAVR